MNKTNILDNGYYTVFAVTRALLSGNDHVTDVADCLAAGDEWSRYDAVLVATSHDVRAPGTCAGLGWGPNC